MHKVTRITYLLLFISLIHLKGMAQVPTSQKLDKNMSLQEVDADGIRWFDPREQPFGLTGFEWIKQDSVYRRLPVNPDWEIRDAVDQRANHTAGGQIRFRTDSRRILIRVEIRERS